MMDSNHINYKLETVPQKIHLPLEVTDSNATYFLASNSLLYADLPYEKNPAKKKFSFYTKSLGHNFQIVKIQNVE
jgi:hypothetical protein